MATQAHHPSPDLAGTPEPLAQRPSQQSRPCFLSTQVTSWVPEKALACIPSWISTWLLCGLFSSGDRQNVIADSLLESPLSCDQRPHPLPISSHGRRPSGPSMPVFRGMGTNRPTLGINASLMSRPNIGLSILAVSLGSISNGGFQLDSDFLLSELRTAYLRPLLLPWIPIQPIFRDSTCTATLALFVTCPVSAHACPSLYYVI